MIEKFLIGGYTKRGGAGIYAASFDPDTATVTTPQPYITSLGSPTYLAVAGGKTLYAVTAGDGVGGVTSFALGAQPKQLNQLLQPGTSPAHVSVDETRQLVFAGNYHEGRVDVYAINADGSLTHTDTVQHHGSGPLPEQDSAHVHFTTVAPDGRLAVVDLGNDTVTTYAVSAGGQLSDERTLTLPAGYGPRHLVFHHRLPIAYLLGELSSQVSVLNYADGTFTLGQTWSTIPADWHAFNGAAAIRLSADDRFLYTSNRGHNSLTVYAVAATGTSLTQVQQISTAGDFPRDFDLDPSQGFVLAVNQKSDNATLYKRASDTGLLTPLVQDIPAPEATNVCFY